MLTVFCNKDSLTIGHNNIILDLLTGMLPLFELKCQVVNARHYQTPNIVERYDRILSEWSGLRQRSDARQTELTNALKKFELNNLFAKFAKKATGMYTHLELCRKELAKPVKWMLWKTPASRQKWLSGLEATIAKVAKEFAKLHKLDAEVKAFHVSIRNPYTSLTMATLEEIWNKTREMFVQRRGEVQRFGSHGLCCYDGPCAFI